MPYTTFDYVYEKIEELEKEYTEKYGCEIAEMFYEIISDLKEWLNNMRDAMQWEKNYDKRRIY